MAEILFYIAIGSFLGGGLFWWTIKLQEHREDPLAVTDLLNYSHLETNGIVRLKDGGLMAMYYYRGPGLSHQTKSMQDHVSGIVSKFLARYGNGWAFYFTGQRSELKGYPTSGKWSDPVNYTIDLLRRQTFSAGKTYYTNKYIFSVVWSPNDRPGLEEFKNQLSEIEEELRVIDSFFLERLEGEEVVQELFYSLNGIKQKVKLPEEKFFVDSFIGVNDIFQIPCKKDSNGIIQKALALPQFYRLQSGEKFISLITITGIPIQTWAGIFEELNELDVEYRFTSRVITMDRKDQEKKINRVRELYRWGRKSPAELMSSSNPNPDMKVQEAYENKHVLNLMKEAGEAIAQVQGNKDSFAQLTSTFVVYADSNESIELQEKNILSRLRKMGCIGVKEDIQPLRALLGTLPGHAENIRRNFMSCKNIADMVPLWGVWTGEENNTSSYMRGAPAHWVAVNVPTQSSAGNKKGQPYVKQQPISGDVGHKLILGPTGSGKSTYINFEISQWRRIKNAQVFLFDKGNSGELLCLASGGTHYDIGGEDGLKFQPFKHLEDNPVWYNDWIEMMVELQGIKPTTSQKREIQKTIQEMKNLPADRRTMTEFVFQIQDNQVREALMVYTSAGKYDIFDGVNDPLEQSDYQVFEQEMLLEMSNQILLPVLDYLFFRVEQSLSTDRPTLIYIEEAWKAFREKNFSDRLEQWLRELRKKNAHVGLITQSPQDILSFDNATLFQDSCPEKVFLANPNAISQHYQEIYRLFGLNDSQIEIIRNAKPKREYYLHSPVGSALVNLKLDDFSLGFLGESSGLTITERRKTIAKLREDHGETWPAEWLRLQGLNGKADMLLSNFNQPE